MLLYDPKLVNSLSMATKNILSVNPYLNGLLLLSITLILLTDLWFNNLPELFQGGGNLLSVLYNLCVGIIGSYIFYFIVVHLKELRDKETINACIAPKLRNIVGDYTAVMSAIKKASNSNLTEAYPSKADIESLFKNINPHSPSPVLGENWLEFIKNRSKRTKYSIKNIFEKMTFLDSILVSHLSKIEDCAYFKELEFHYPAPLRNITIEFLSTTFHQYSLLSQTLDQYTVENFK